MALQLRPVQVNWTDRFTNPTKWEAAARINLAGDTNPAVQQSVRQAPTPQVQQLIQRQAVPGAPAPATQPRAAAPNIWQTVGDFLGADAFKRTGEGIAEIINEINGTAQKQREQKAKQDQEDLSLIKHYGTLMKSGDAAVRQRAEAALTNLMRQSDASSKAFTERQNQIIDRADPTKNIGAAAELGLTYGTLGVGAGAAKAAAATGKILTKAAAKEAAIGAALGAGSGVANAYQRNGAAANQDPETFNQALIGGAVGGILPTVGRVAGKGVNAVVNRTPAGTAPEVKAVEKNIVEAIKPKVSMKKQYKSEETELRALTSVSKNRVLDINEKARLKELQTSKKANAIVESELTQASGRLKRGSRGEIASTLDSVDESDVFKNRGIINRVKNELGQHFVEDQNQMLGLLKRIEKETDRKGLVDQYYYDTGRIRVANAIADSRVAGSEDIRSLFKGLKDFSTVGRKMRQLAGQDGKSQLDRFDDYAAARAELRNYEGKRTSKTKEELAAIVANGHKEFDERFTAMNNFYKDQAKYLYENGIISKKKMDYYQKNPDYIRIQRDVEDLVNQTRPGSKSTSFNSTTTKQRRKGSSREVLSPTRTLLERAQQMELEVQRNRAANHTIDVLQEYGLARRVPDSNSKNTVGRYRGGKKEFWEVPKDVKEQMDNLKPYSIGPVMQIISAPNRLLRAGATGLNVPFAAANYFRDQVGSAIQSKHIAATHNHFVVIKSLASAARDMGDGSTDPLWKKFEEFTGNQTVYDELRNQKATNKTLRELRTGTRGRMLNRAISPVRSLEDFIGITEKATRFQNFKGTYIQALKANGGDEAAALKEATLAARKNTTDFNRAGDWGRVLNGFIPYFNASIQGTRTLARSFKERPVSTSMKTIGTVAIPSIAAAAWNYADPARAEAYESINDYEKKDNWILIGPDARQRSDGTWEDIIKIPKPPGYRDLTDPVRDVAESFFSKQDKTDVGNILQDLLGVVSGPIQTGSTDQIVGSFIPQQAKPFAQAYLNKDFYTGRDVVPEYMVEGTSDKSKQVYENTSGTARMLAKQLGVSPITVEKFIKDTGASIGLYGLNAVDQGAAQAGLIPKEQIGGKSAVEDVKGRFMEAKGDLLERNKTEGQKYFESVKRARDAVGLNENEKAAYDAYHEKRKNFLGEEIFDGSKTYDPASRVATYLKYPKTFEVDKRINDERAAKGEPSNPLYSLSGDNLKKVLEKEALPPGAKDPELSNLYKEDWYADYSNKKSQYFDAIAAKLKAEGKETKTSDYPQTAPEVQSAMDAYNALPKGTGARSAWIRANPDAWSAMTSQWEAVDAWQNKKRKDRGLAATEGEEGKANGYDTGTSSSSGYSRRGGGGSRGSGINEYGYQVKSGGASVKLAAGKRKKRVALKSVAKGGAKPKVSIKKQLLDGIVKKTGRNKHDI